MKKRTVTLRASGRAGSRFVRLAIMGLVLLFAVACLLFVLENQQRVVVSFFGFSSPELRVSIVGVVAFLAGVLVGGLMVAVYALRARRRVRQISH